MHCWALSRSSHGSFHRSIAGFSAARCRLWSCAIFCTFRFRERRRLVEKRARNCAIHRECSITRSNFWLSPVRSVSIRSSNSLTVSAFCSSFGFSPRFFAIEFKKPSFDFLSIVRFFICKKVQLSRAPTFDSQDTHLSFLLQAFLLFLGALSEIFVVLSRLGEGDQESVKDAKELLRLDH